MFKSDYDFSPEVEEAIAAELQLMFDRLGIDVEAIPFSTIARHMRKRQWQAENQEKFDA